MLPEKQAEFLSMLPTRQAGDVHALHYLKVPGRGYHCLDLDLHAESEEDLNAKVTAYFAAASIDTVLPAAPERFWHLMASKSGPLDSFVKKADRIFPLRLQHARTPRTAVILLKQTEQD